MTAGTSAALAAEDAHTAPASAGRPGAGLLGVAIVVGASLGSAACAALANWVAANGLGPAGFGLFSLGMAVMTVLQEVGGPALDLAVVRRTGALVHQAPGQAETYFRVGWHLKLAISGGLSALLLLCATPLALLFDQPPLAVVLRWMALCLLMANLSTGPMARLQSAERFGAYAVLRVMVNALKVLLLAGVLWVGALTPSSAAMAWAASFLLVALSGWWLCRGTRVAAKPVPGERPVRDIMRFARWAMLSGLLFAIHLRTDMLLLGHFGTPAEVGQYAVAWNLMLLLDLITSSLVIALTPMAARAATPVARAQLRRRTLALALGVAVLLLPLYVLAEPMVQSLFPTYGGAVAPFRLLFWSSIVVLLIYPLYLSFYAQDRAAPVSAMYGVVVLCGVALGPWLIPQQGAIGAAMTTLLARLAGAAFIVALLWREMAHERRTASGAAQ